MAWPEDDARHREVAAALRAWAQAVDSVPYPPGLDIEALMARHYESLREEPAMTIAVTATVEATVLVVRGEIDLAGARRLRDRLAEEFGLGPRMLVVDLTGTTHCSARGLAVLLEATEDAREAGVLFAIAGCAPLVWRAVDALGLGEALPIHPTTAAALEWLDLLSRLRTLR